MSAKAKGTRNERPLRAGDSVRLKSGGPQGRIVRPSPGGKFRVAWQFLYYSNHAPEKLMRAGEKAGGERWQMNPD
jgi:uncharacterized protein YodC (DUF2158 family)